MSTWRIELEESDPTSPIGTRWEPVTTREAETYAEALVWAEASPYARPGRKIRVVPDSDVVTDDLEDDDFDPDC